MLKTLTPKPKPMEKTYRPHAAPDFKADELLPCPMCGSEAELIFVGNPYTKKISTTAKCTNKMCRVQRTDATLKGDAEWVAKVTIKRWNERQPIERTVDEGEIDHLIEGYKIKIGRLNDMLSDKSNRKEPALTRLRTKQGEYRVFIHELNRIKAALTHRQPEKDYPRPDADGAL